MEKTIGVSSQIEAGEGTAQTAMNIAAEYDVLRLRTYRDGESLHSRIRIRSIGESTLLRFDDVGYFNRIYAADTSLISHLAEVEGFYAGCPFPCEFVFRDEAQAEVFAPACRERGWSLAKAYVWLSAPAGMLVAPPVPDEFDVRETTYGEEELFLSTYLASFEADTSSYAAAMRNMRHLFRYSSLTFLLATSAGKAAGVGMTYSDGNGGMFFCAGATLPEFRNRGCHHALLAARVRLARESGADQVYSWAASNGQSQKNMEQIGLEIVGSTPSWKYSPA